MDRESASKKVLGFFGEIPRLLLEMRHQQRLYRRLQVPARLSIGIFFACGVVVRIRMRAHGYLHVRRWAPPSATQRTGAAVRCSRSSGWGACRR